jgi:lysozyme
MVVVQPRRRLYSLGLGIGVGSDAMDLKSQLLREEGAESCAYQDSLGYWTIGVGRLIDPRKGGGLSPDEIDFLLENDIKTKTREVLLALPWMPRLSEPRQAVLIGMAFQMGMKGLLQFKRMLSAVEDGQYFEAAAQMVESTWAKQTPARAQRLSKQMETDQWQ